MPITIQPSPLPGDPLNKDIRQEAREVGGDDWLQVQNARLGGRTPEEVIAAEGLAGEALVRDILDSIRYIGSS